MRVNETLLIGTIMYRGFSWLNSGMHVTGERTSRAFDVYSKELNEVLHLYWADMVHGNNLLMTATCRKYGMFVDAIIQEKFGP